jgi:hypothetical protein
MPQIVFGPFMAGTMVEDAHAVKPLFPGRESPSASTECRCGRWG